MKTWKKGVILGGIWGIISEILFFQFIFGGIGDDIFVKSKILAFPAYATLVILDFFLQGETPQKSILLNWNIILLTPIIIGALIGSIIGLLYEKWRGRK